MTPLTTEEFRARMARMEHLAELAAHVLAVRGDPACRGTVAEVRRNFVQIVKDAAELVRARQEFDLINEEASFAACCRGIDRAIACWAGAPAGPAGPGPQGGLR